MEEGLRGFLAPSSSRSSWVQSRMQEKESDPEALSVMVQVFILEGMVCKPSNLILPWFWSLYHQLSMQLKGWINYTLYNHWIDNLGRHLQKVDASLQWLARYIIYPLEESVSLKGAMKRGASTCTARTMRVWSKGQISPWLYTPGIFSKFAFGGSRALCGVHCRSGGGGLW